MNTETTDQLARRILDSYNALQIAKNNYDELIKQVTERVGGAKEGTCKLTGEEFEVTHTQRSRAVYADKDKFNEIAERAFELGIFTKTYKEDRRRVEGCLAKKFAVAPDIKEFLASERVLKLNKPTINVGKRG